jgi:hypothetical protein
MELSAQKQERIQLAMASEQAEANFRNTVLATLPLLRNEKDRIQFLTEQFVPRLKDTEDEFIYFPISWIASSCEKNDTFRNYLESKAGEELKRFLSEGKELAIRCKSHEERETEIEAMRESLTQQTNSRFGLVGLVKISLLWALLFAIVYLILKFAGV